MPPLLNLPARTTDLAVQQRGAELVLRWTAPGRTTEGFPIGDLERVVVLGREVEGDSVDARSFESGAHEILVLEQPAAGERIERRLALPAAPGKRFGLAIKNYNRRRRSEGLSNVVIVEIAAALAAPRSLNLIPLAGAIRLEWPPVPGAQGYRIYRATTEQREFALLAEPEKPPFDDPNFTWNQPYTYFVRSYLKIATGAAESPDSPTAAILPKDTFPPTPPSELRMVVSETAVELSWNLSPEPDTAGYNVYRRDASGQTARINTELQTAPAFSDKQVQRQQHYFYSVSAVDDKGNESAPSAPIEVTIP